MSATAIISCRFIARQEQSVPIEVLDQRTTTGDEMQELAQLYWREATEAGMSREEAAQYVTGMMS